MESRAIREINAVAIPHPAGCGVSSSRAMRFGQMAGRHHFRRHPLRVIKRAPQCIRHDLDAKRRGY